MKLAKFMDIIHGNETVTGDWAEASAHYVRISEYVDTEFPPLDQEILIGQKLDAIDRAIERYQYSAEIDKLKERKAALMLKYSEAYEVQEKTTGRQVIADHWFEEGVF